MSLNKPKFDIILSEETGGDEQGSVITKHKTQLPRKYKVLLHNDDYTTMEFVIFILQKVFKKTLEEAKAIMLKVHNEGMGVCGVYTREVAETKSVQVRQLSKENGHPLKCTFEPE